MKLSTYAFAAVVAATAIAPTLASAQDIRVRIGDDRGMARHYDRDYHGPRAEYRGDRGCIAAGVTATGCVGSSSAVITGIDLTKVAPRGATFVLLKRS